MTCVELAETSPSFPPFFAMAAAAGTTAYLHYGPEREQILEHEKRKSYRM